MRTNARERRRECLDSRRRPNSDASTDRSKRDGFRCAHARRARRRSALRHIASTRDQRRTSRASGDARGDGGRGDGDGDATNDDAGRANERKSSALGDDAVVASTREGDGDGAAATRADEDVVADVVGARDDDARAIRAACRRRRSSTNSRRASRSARS
jgi:hypothetical protein